MEGDKNTSCSHLHVYRQLLSHHTKNTAAEPVTCSEHSWLWFHYHGRNTQLQWRKKCLCMYVCTEFIYRMFWRVRRQVRWRRGDPAAEPRWHQWCSRSDWWRQEQKKLIYWQLSVRLQPVHDINHRNVLKRLVSVGSDSLREERSPARHETWRSGQPQQHHHQENSPSEHLLRAGRQNKERGWINE